jgi:diadenylate cyclase
MSFFTDIALPIAIIFIIVNYLMSFFWNLRGKEIVFLLFLVMLAYWASNTFQWTFLYNFLSSAAYTISVIILILFQQEFRAALNKLSSIWGIKPKELDKAEKLISNLTQSIYQLSHLKIGALVLVENQDSLEEYAAKAVPINASFTSELLQSLFMPSSPLHDGAIIISQQKILCAATILPLAESSPQIPKSIGTRHRAGLGISQRCDCVAIIVSEETGKVSLAIDGIITRAVKPERFKSVLRSFLVRGNIASGQFDIFKGLTS